MSAAIRPATRLSASFDIETPTVGFRYQDEVRRQKLMIKKAEINEQRLLFLVTALRRLLGDEHFRTLLRAEGFADMPQPLAERLHP